MTMMTPMGQGGRMYPRSRRWPRALAVLVVLALVVAVGAGAWWSLTRDEPAAAPAPTASATCRTKAAKPPKSIPPPGQVMVDVANGTDQAGLAINTSDTLTERGFRIVGIGNTERPVKQGVAQVRYREARLGAAIRLASYVPGAQLVPVPRLRRATVLLWLGPEFAGVATKKKADPSAVVLPQADSVCPTSTGGKD